MSIKANNLTEIVGLKAGQRVIQVDGKWVAVGVGCKPGGGDTSDLPHLEISDLEISEGVLVLHGQAQIPEITGFDLLSIVGIGDLAAENIAYGKTICGITGTLGGSIPGSSGDYIIPDDFKDGIQIAFWRSYEPIQTVILDYVAGGEPTDRVWSKGAYTLYFTEGRWTIAWWNEALELTYGMAFNTTLRKHKWEIVDPPVTQDTNLQFDFISLEDKNWHFTEI